MQNNFSTSLNFKNCLHWILTLNFNNSLRYIVIKYGVVTKKSFFIVKKIHYFHLIERFQFYYLF